MQARLVTLRPTSAAMAFLLPNFVGFLAFTAGPVIVALFAAFTNWDLQETGKIQWIGLANFRELLSDTNFWLSTSLTRST